MDQTKKNPWKVEMDFHGQKVLLPGSYVSREEAEWAVALWKQNVLLYSDPFSYFQEQEERKER